MKEYKFEVYGLITIMGMKKDETLKFSIFAKYALQTEVINELKNRGYVVIDGKFYPYHAITSIEITEFKKIA